MPELMKQSRLSQAEFARVIDVSESFVSKIISLESKFSIIKAKRAAIALRCSIDDLYEWDLSGNR